jgi:hypothetical protein
MANNEPTYFIDDAAVTAREAEYTVNPDTSFDNGMNAGGSNAPGIGIGENAANVAGTPEQFTLLDQHGANGTARTPQISQSIGGYPYTDPAGYPSSGGTEGTAPDAVIRFGANDSGGDGTMTGTGNATLSTLAAGWTAV